MIKITRGNLLTTDAEALVNTVNCKGYMGKGIALQFKKAFPDNFKAYERACRHKEIYPGRLFVFETGSMTNPKYIINFPTKRHWRGNSRIKDIESGLKALIDEIRRLKITSIAVPPLGCGLGGLNWLRVRPMIEGAFAALSDVQVILFEPAGTPEPETMPVKTERPKLTPARALLIQLIRQYGEMAYRCTLLEIQKLAYFLQEAGEPLHLRYEAGIYGPYAHNLNKVLEVLEAHYTRGYGDSQKPDVEIELLPGAVEEAKGFLEYNKDSLARLERIASLIDGFETPYGMELLSSAHWVATHTAKPIKNDDDAIQAVHQWNDRKRNLLKPEHIRIAWDRLSEQDWLANRVSIECVKEMRLSP